MLENQKSLQESIATTEQKTQPPPGASCELVSAVV